MIGSLRGRVLHRTDGEVLVEVGGVGYRVTVAAGSVAGTALGEPIFLHIHTHVREDALVPVGVATNGSTSPRSEVREALAGLGYGPDEVREALAALPTDGPDDTAVLLRHALRALASA